MSGRKINPTRLSRSQSEYPSKKITPKLDFNLPDIEHSNKKGQVPSPRAKCPHNAYILILGQSGAGKSTTFNYMFGGKEIAPVEREEGTDSINVYRAPIKTLDSEPELRIIDSPGLGDMNSLNWDARIIKSLEIFMTENDELKNCLPNIVMILGRFDDNRIDGDSSNFVKSLKAINSQKSKLLDTKNNNVVIVLTHVMNGKKALRTDPTPRIQLVKLLIKTHVKFPHEPVVILAENEPDDWNLKEESGSFILPHGELYPKNIFEGIITICHEANDKVGEKVFQLAMVNRTTLQLSLHKQVPLVDELTSENMAAMIAKLYNSKISDLGDQLSVSWNAKGKSIDDKNFQGFLKVLEQNQIKTVNDFPKQPEKVLKLLSKLKHIYDQDIHEILSSFGTIAPQFKPEKQNIGFGYNIGNDEFTSEHPLNQVKRFIPSKLGFRIPGNVIYDDPDKPEEVVFEIFDSRTTYNQLRHQHLKLSDTGFVIEGKFVPGHSLVDPIINTSDKKSKIKLPTVHKKDKHKSIENFDTTGENPSQGTELQKTSKSSKYITFAKEFRLGKLSYSSINNRDYNPKFANEVEKMSPFSRESRHSLNDWRKFFVTWGTHVAVSVFVGGTLIVSIEEKELKRCLGNQKGKGITTQDKNKLESIFRSLITYDTVQSKDIDGMKYKIELNGGEEICLQDTYPPKQSLVEMVKKWEASLQLNPVVLKSDLVLTPMKDYVQDIMKEETWATFDDALQMLYEEIPSKHSTLNLWGRVKNKCSIL